MASAGPPSGRTKHPVSATGVVLATVSAVLFVFLWLLETLGLLQNPYLGLFAFIAIPLVFVLGLLLIVLGHWLARRRLRRGRPEAARWPTFDLNDARTRRFGLALVVTTSISLLILAVAGYGAVDYLESPSFCGQVCHQPMSPHFVQWRAGPYHSRVPCVACHVGTGAVSFVRSKIRGMKQLERVAAGSFPRPLATPVRTMRPATFTCEHCHSPERFTGEKVKVLKEYADDSTNTETQTVLRLHVGGGPPSLGRGTGIHWHTYPGNEIDYIAIGAKRDSIPWVRLKDRTGRVQEFVVEGFDRSKAPAAPRRMDCIDCHNRPAHPFGASPERVVDGAIAVGRLDRSLPFIRREAVRVLKQPPDSASEAAGAIQRAIEGFYRDGYADLYRSRRQDVTLAAAVVEALRNTHVFPTMRITWGTYSSLRGHVDAAGCFRCHDDAHKASNGAVIRQDCELCHAIEEPR